jgi:phosphoribosylaminoimidazolecarboxamide formyltransferase/IMP cyclohydrolase
MKKYALLSVTDKTGILDLAKGLLDHGYSLLSTGGTSALLKSKGLSVLDVSEFTGFSEVLEGRVKTLHPKVHSGILFDRKKHELEAKSLEIEAIDMVVVNLYDFANEAKNKKLGLEEAIEFIDIGGPTMLRGAAKNWQYVLPVMEPSDYGRVLEFAKQGDFPKGFRLELARKVFATTSRYDAMIAQYFKASEPGDSLPVSLSLVSSLRYGENPKQKAALYKPSWAEQEGFCDIEILQGKELSYNNYLDLDAASAVIREFPKEMALTIIKHNNPCGTAIAGPGDSLADVYRKALSGDPRSAFGGILAANRDITEEAAREMSSLFLECILAPSFSAEAKEIFSQKKNLRLIAAKWLLARSKPELTFKSIQGAVLVQDQDFVNEEGWKVATKRHPTPEESADLAFAWKVSAHVKSNAIVFAKNGLTLTVGAGQMSRIDSATFAGDKALAEGKALRGAVMASDAFFPFRDTVDLAAKYGISAIIQPGGSMRDQDSIDACNEAQIAMVFTGERHFKH